MTIPIDYDPTGTDVYWFEPHQDDGNLFFGQGGPHHVLAGRRLHVVLMSNGEPSSVLAKINGTAVDNTWWIGTHDPAHEGYEPLTSTQFGLARTNEWRAAWRSMGVPDDRMHYGMDLAGSDLLPDAISKDYATEVMQYWMDRSLSTSTAIPSMYAMWWKDLHADHAACGQALHALRVADADFANSRWMTKPEDATRAGAAVYGVPATMLDQVKSMQRQGAQPYGAWQPEQGAYAIGFHSVYTPYFNPGPLTGAANHIVSAL